MSSSTTTEDIQDLRPGIRALMFFAAVMYTIRLWHGLDPDPEPVAAAIKAASADTAEAYVVTIGLTVFGLLGLLRYILGAVVRGLASATSGFLSWVCIGTIVLLACGVLTPYVLGCLGFAAIGAAGANWLVEAARYRNSPG